jgi:alkaline phosphatase D
VRIVQVSDTHLSRTHHDFADNNKRIAALITSLAPDLIIHTGDVSMDGAGDTRDLDLSRDWIGALPADTLLVPGNHDVGDLPAIKASQPVDDARLAAWRNVFGCDRWVRDIPGWRLIGLNAMLCGTGHAQEERQLEWLARELDTRTSVALFMHKPLCIDAVSEGARGYWTVAPEPRRRLHALIAAAPVRMIATGHLHIHRRAEIDGIALVWGPAASFVCGDSQEDLGGERRLGIIEHVFSLDGVASHFLRTDDLEELRIEPVIDRIYPRLPEAMAQ